MLEGMTVQRRAPILSWREWLAAEFTILRSVLRGLRRRWPTSTTAQQVSQQMKAMVWAVSPHDGHRHVFSRPHLTGATLHGYAQAWCSHPAPLAGLQATIRRTAPLCIACTTLAIDLLASTGGHARCLGSH